MSNEGEPMTDIDGQGNTCTHTSATGVDTTSPRNPGKVWACDHCGLRWRHDGGDTPALVVDTREALAKALWQVMDPLAELSTGMPDPQHSPRWEYLADALLASGVVTTAEAHREQIARVEALLERMAERREELWGNYIDGPGGHIEALHQGMFNAFEDARHMVRAALTPQGPADD